MDRLCAILTVITSVVLPAACFVFSCVRLRRDPRCAVGGIASHALFGMAADELVFMRLYSFTPAMYMLSVTSPENYSLAVAVCSSALLCAGIYIIMKALSPAELDSFTVIAFGCGFASSHVIWRSGISSVYMLITARSRLYENIALTFMAASSLSMFVTSVCCSVLMSETILKKKGVCAVLAFGILSMSVYPAVLGSQGVFSTSVSILSAVIGTVCAVNILKGRLVK